MIEAYRSPGPTESAFVNALVTRQDGKYALAVLGLCRVRRFAKPPAGEIDILMPPDFVKANDIYNMMHQTGRVDCGDVSRQTAQAELEKLASDAEHWRQVHTLTHLAGDVSEELKWSLAVDKANEALQDDAAGESSSHLPFSTEL